MKIDELVPFKMINLEKMMSEVDPAIDGSFKHLYEKAKKHELNVLVDNNGNVIGGEYVSGKVGAEDAAAQRVFEQKYCCKPLMDWLKLALTLAQRNDIDEVLETATAIKVVDNRTGEIGTVWGKDEDCKAPGCDEDCENCPSRNCVENDLPSNVTVDMEEVDLDNIEVSIKSYLRKEFGHYLAKGCELDIEEDEENGVYYVDNIEWGRKI